MGKALRETNQRYGMSRRIENIAKDRMSRVNANNAFGLGDRIAGGAGAVVGGAALAASGERDPADILIKGAGMGLLSAAGNHVASRYGNAVMARGLDRTGGMLRDSGQAAAGLLDKPGMLGRLAVGSQQKKRKGLVGKPGGIIPISDKDTP